MAWYEPQPVQVAQPAPVGAPGTTHSNGVTIRPLRDTPDDCAFAGKIMVEAFEDKFAHSVTREKLPIVKRIVASYNHGQPPQFYTRNLVAEVDGKPVGFMGLKFKGDRQNDNADHLCELGCYRACRFVCFGCVIDSEISERHQSLLDVVGVDALTSGRGVGKALMFMCFGCVMDSEVSERHQCLLEVVGVDALARGRGVGKAFMERAEAEARREGCREIYLMVITTNRARNLYERQGFTVTSTHSNCCFKCVAGPPGSYHVMTKQL